MFVQGDRRREGGERKEEGEGRREEGRGSGKGWREGGGKRDLVLGLLVNLVRK